MKKILSSEEEAFFSSEWNLVRRNRISLDRLLGLHRGSRGGRRVSMTKGGTLSSCSSKEPQHGGSDERGHFLLLSYAGNAVIVPGEEDQGERSYAVRKDGSEHSLSA